MTLPAPTRGDTRARNGYLVITALRFTGIAMIMAGFAIVRGVIDLPYALGAVLAVLGFIEFFFLPRVAARRWNAGAKDTP